MAKLNIMAGAIENLRFPFVQEVCPRLWLAKLLRLSLPLDKDDIYSYAAHQKKISSKLTHSILQGHSWPPNYLF